MYGTYPDSYQGILTSEMSLRSPQKGDALSLEYEIQEAKRRAHEFSQSLQNSRREESESMRLVEEERRRWDASYEEKTVMIEQLQRELSSTVEALHAERSTDGNRKEELDLSKSGGYKQNIELRHATNHRLDSTGHSGDDSYPVGPMSFEAKHHSVADEVEGLKLQLSTQKKTEELLKQKIEQQALELEQAKKACQHAEEQLRVRNHQFRQWEAEREARDRIEADLRAQVWKLEKARMKRELDAKVQEACKEDASEKLRLQLAESYAKIADMECKMEDLSHALQRKGSCGEVSNVGGDGSKISCNGHVSSPEEGSTQSVVGPSRGPEGDWLQIEEGGKSLIETTHRLSPHPDHILGTHIEEGGRAGHTEKVPEARRSLDEEGTRRVPVRIPTPVVLPHTQPGPAPIAAKKASGLSPARYGADLLSSTATHAILDMQAYSPPRMVLQADRGTARTHGDDDQYDYDGNDDMQKVGGGGAGVGGSVMGVDNSLDSLPPKMSTRLGRGHRANAAMNGTKSPTKMAFNVEVEADDESDVIVLDDEANADGIVLHSPRRCENTSNGNDVGSDRSCVRPDRSAQESSVHRPVSAGRRHPQAQRRNSAGSKTLQPSPTTQRKTSQEKSWSSSKAKASGTKVCDVAGYRAVPTAVATTSSTSSSTRRQSVGSDSNTSDAQAGRKKAAGGDNKSANVKGASKRPAVTVPSKSVTAKAIAPGSRASPVPSHIVRPSSRSQSAPPKSRQSAPIAFEMPNSKQQKVTLLQAKHSRTRSSVSARDKNVSKQTPVVHIPKSTMANRVSNTSNDLSLSLNSATAGRISTWK